MSKLTQPAAYVRVTLIATMPVGSIAIFLVERRQYLPYWTDGLIAAALGILVFLLATRRGAYWRRRKGTDASLVDLTARAISRDPLDGPTLCLEADIMADDMERYAPTALDPWEVWGDGPTARKAPTEPAA